MTFIRRYLPALLSLAGTLLTIIFKKQNEDEAHDRAMERWMEKHHPEL